MRRVKGILGVLAGLMLLFHAGATVAYADDRGNNGTLKVVSATDPGNDNDNDPKVCSFHLSGIGFDKSSSGTWSISGQGGNAGSASASGAWTANANGSWQTANMTLANGHYKASAKQTNTSGGEKQKVFTVACGQGTTGGNNGQEHAATPTPVPAQQGNGGNNVGAQPASMTGTGSRSKAGGSKSGTKSKSKAGGSATGTGSQSKQNATNGASATGAGSVASNNGGTDNTASVSEHGEIPAGGTQGNLNVPNNANGGNAGTGNTGNGANAGAGTGGNGGAGAGGNAGAGGAAGATGGSGAQGNLNVPQTGAQGNVTMPTNAAGVSASVSNLPSTSTDSSAPLTALGALLMGLGAFLLRRPGRSLR